MGVYLKINFLTISNILYKHKNHVVALVWFDSLHS